MAQKQVPTVVVTAEVPPDADDPTESQRFIDMAREIEVDESPEAFDRAFKAVVKPKRPGPAR